MKTKKELSQPIISFIHTRGWHQANLKIDECLRILRAGSVKTIKDAEENVEMLISHYRDLFNVEKEAIELKERDDHEDIASIMKGIDKKAQCEKNLVILKKAQQHLPNLEENFKDLMLQFLQDLPKNSRIQEYI